MAGIEKEIMLKEVKSKLENRSIFFASFEKMTVDDFGSLRNTLSKKEANGFVVKKRIAKLALKELGLEEAADGIVGPLFMVATEANQPALSKDLVNFAKEKESFVINGVYMDGSYHPTSYVETLSSLPSRDELIASVVCGAKAPINNFVLGLNSLLRSFVVVLNEVSKQKSN